MCPESGAPRPAGAPFRWGVLGSGAAAGKFVLGLRHADGARAVVVASRTPARAREFAGRYGIPAVADSYEEAIAAQDVDAFHLAVPPTEHRALALACIGAGTPVLVEKPFAADLAAAEDIAGAARERSVFCMEGLWTRFLPLLRRAQRLVEDGGIGEVRTVIGSFGRAASRTAEPGLFAADSGGGALAHRGIYPLSLATALLGPPVEVVSRASLVSGVDADSVVVARHARGGTSVSTASLLTQATNDLVVQGTRGTIHVHAPVYRPYRMTLIRVAPAAAAGRFERLREGALLQAARQRLGGLPAHLSGQRRPVRVPYAGNGYQYEAEEVARCVRAGRTESPVMPLADSLAVARAMAEARRQWTR